MKELNPELLEKLLKLASDRLTGEWLLIGGTLLPALGIEIRATVDVDLIGLTEKESSQTLALMEIAESLGLSIETINQAAAFFLQQISYKKTDLIKLLSGKKCTVYRPSVWLYWSLKLKRLSSTDLLDCTYYFQYCKVHNDKIDLHRLQDIVDEALHKKNSEEKRERLKKLKSLVEK